MADDRIGVVFDLEDAGPLEGDVGNVAAFHALGVRALAPTYNHRNAAGGGCLDVDDSGLTPFGRDLLRELNAVGVTADGSHGSARTGLDLCAYSDKPVVYSHSNLRSSLGSPAQHHRRPGSRLRRHGRCHRHHRSGHLPRTEHPDRRRHDRAPRIRDRPRRHRSRRTRLGLSVRRRRLRPGTLRPPAPVPRRLHPLGSDRVRAARKPVDRPA